MGQYNIQNKILVTLNNSKNINISKIKRDFLTNSSCGVCGKSSLDALEILKKDKTPKSNPKLSKDIIINSPSILRQNQSEFSKTGGIHASGLFSSDGKLISLREDFWKNVRIPGDSNSMNKELEKAGRVADLIELGELFAKDALERNESCGGHFREESVEIDGMQKGEAKRDDKNYTYVSAWEYVGQPSEAILHKEELSFKDIELKQRSYK